MPNPEFDPSAQVSITMPNGVVGTGVGGDVEALTEAVEQRHEERTGEAAEAVATDAQGKTVESTPKQTRGEKRFAELTREREDANRRAEAAERERDELRAKINPPPTEKIEAAKPAVAETRPKPQESDIGVKYQSLSDYFEDLSDWKSEQRETKLRAEFDARLKNGIEADRASRNRASTFEQAITRGRAAYTDFDATLDTAKNVLIPPMQQDAIMRVAKPEDIMYALAKDHAKLTAFVSITDPIQLGMDFAKLIPVAEAVALPASTPAPVRTTNAPAPLQPVGAGSRTARPSLNELANSNYDAYKAARAAGQVN